MSMTDDDKALVERLRELFERATPGGLATAERHILSEYVECPMCSGDGEVGATDYCNFDGVALGVQFYGIGKEFGAHERLWSELIKSAPVLMDRIEALSAENERLREALTQIARLRTDLSGDFSLGSHQSDIARAALGETK